MAFAIGVDFGTGSCRAVVVRCADGAEVGTGVFGYPQGTDGVLLDPKDHNLARQHPADHVAGLEATILAAIVEAKSTTPDFSPDRVIGIGVDTTGSSPLPVDAKNQALALQPKWRDNLNAACWLWKDHTSADEAAAITGLAREHRPHYVAKCGNTYSSEWFWAKIWRCLKVDPEVYAAAHSWVELADWLPSLLAGVTDPAEVRRGVCAAGHKALYAEDWGGLPDKEFLALLDPALAELRDRLYEQAHDAATPAGHLGSEWALKLGLPEGIPIAIGEFDVHYGAIGSGVAEGTLVKVIGTSTCDCAVVPADREIADIPGICGIVKGAILPGFYGIEAGQSAVGDIFAWFTQTVCRGDSEIHARLQAEALQSAPGASGLLALDWNNGNRTILVDQRLTGLLVGQTLQTTQAEIYRALIEATAFGARMILDRIEAYGVPVQRIICAGGIAEKSPLLMQIYADVLGREIATSRSGQTCALGAALTASVLAGSAKGGHDCFQAAQEAMTGIKPETYQPEPAAVAVYQQIFAEYQRLHDAFGGVETRDLGNVMKNLLQIKEVARST